MSVPVSIGKAVLVQAKVAARTRSHPSSIFTTIISTAMMASSTSSPRAMSAPRVMRSRVHPGVHHHEADGQHQRHAECDHHARSATRG